MSTKRLITFKHWFILTLTMNKGILVFSFLYLIGQLLAVSVDPYQRHVILTPNSASEVFYTGSERQILAPAPVSETPVPVAAQAAPVAAVAPAPIAFSSPVAAVPAASAASLAFGSPAAVAAPAAPLNVAAPVPVAPAIPVVAKVVQFKLSHPQYAYGYSVQDFTTGDNKVAKEVREGNIVKGSYSVADPDGTKRTVNYYADPVHGFNAVVHKTQIFK